MDKIQKERTDVQKKLDDIEKKQEMMKKLYELERQQQIKTVKRPAHYEMM